ncbi:hypothetical protein D8S78_23880 [Natrialba swarupiae]|nr:hypothetical protein [Natrialba swarupiae]
MLSVPNTPMLIDTVLHPGTMLVVGIVVLLFLLIRLKLHPFLALIVTTFLIGILSRGSTR